jgi:hypothetical protein
MSCFTIYRTPGSPREIAPQKEQVKASGSQAARGQLPPARRLTTGCPVPCCPLPPSPPLPLPPAPAPCPRRLAQTRAEQRGETGEPDARPARPHIVDSIDSDSDKGQARSKAFAHAFAHASLSMLASRSDTSPSSHSAPSSADGRSSGSYVQHCSTSSANDAGASSPRCSGQRSVAACGRGGGGAPVV